MLYALFNMKAESSYRPVYKINENSWQRLEKEVTITNVEGCMVLSF